MRICVVVLALMLTAACASSKRSGKDYTRNPARSKEPVVSSTAPAAKGKRESKSGIKSNKSGSAIPEETTDDIYAAPPAVEPVAPTAPAASVAPEPADATAIDIVGMAESLVGARYRYGGNSPERGFDCSGLTCYVYSNMGIVLPRTSSDQSRFGKRKKLNETEPGDLVFFGTGSRVTHVGIVVDRTASAIYMVHSSSSGGVRRDEILSSTYWNSRVLWAVSPFE